MWFKCGRWFDFVGAALKSLSVAVAVGEKKKVSRIAEMALLILALLLLV